MQEYKTFTAALLAAAEASPERAAALKAMTYEPQSPNDQNGQRLVIFTTPIFTLIVRREPGRKTWSYSWTWTDTAAR